MSVDLNHFEWTYFSQHKINIIFYHRLPSFNTLLNMWTEMFDLKCKSAEWAENTKSSKLYHLNILSQWFHFSSFVCAGGGICEETVGVEMCCCSSSMLWASEWRNSSTHCVLLLFSQLLHKGSQMLQPCQRPGWFWKDITACFWCFHPVVALFSCQQTHSEVSLCKCNFICLCHYLEGVD